MLVMAVIQQLSEKMKDKMKDNIDNNKILFNFKKTEYLNGLDLDKLNIKSFSNGIKFQLNDGTHMKEFMKTKFDFIKLGKSLIDQLNEKSINFLKEKIPSLDIKGEGFNIKNGEITLNGKSLKDKSLDILKGLSFKNDEIKKEPVKTFQNIERKNL